MGACRCMEECTDILGIDKWVDELVAYRCSGTVWGCRDVWGIQMYGGCTDVGAIQICGGMNGGIQTYRSTQGYSSTYRCMGFFTEVWGAYKCMEVVQMYEAIQTYGGCMGAYKCTGEVQMYGGMYRSMGSIQK